MTEKEIESMLSHSLGGQCIARGGCHMSCTTVSEVLSWFTHQSSHQSGKKRDREVFWDRVEVTAQCFLKSHFNFYLSQI